MSELIRVLHVATQMHRAGLETMLMNYYRHIDRERIQFDFLVHREERYDYDDEILALGGRIYRIRPIHMADFAAYLKDLIVFFSAHQEYKIVHSHLDGLSAFPLGAAQYAGIPVRIAHSHNNGFERDGKLLLRSCARPLARWTATDFWGCSHEALVFMFGNSAHVANAAFILRNAIDVKKFDYSSSVRHAIRQELGISDHQFVVGHIGRFTYAKNHNFLLKIHRSLTDKKKDAVLILVGGGEYEAEIKEQIAQLGLQASVRFSGVRDDVPAMLSAMDVLLMPSHYEGFGMVLLEAQAAGLPCVASDSISKEVNITRSIHFLSLSSSADIWADTVLGCYGKRYDNAHMLYKSGYDIHDSARELLEKYEELYYGGRNTP